RTGEARANVVGRAGRRAAVGGRVLFGEGPGLPGRAGLPLRATVRLGRTRPPRGRARVGPAAGAAATRPAPAPPGRPGAIAGAVRPPDGRTPGLAACIVGRSVRWHPTGHVSGRSSSEAELEAPRGRGEPRARWSTRRPDNLRGPLGQPGLRQRDRRGAPDGTD